jgi:hypothetical protein
MPSSLTIKVLSVPLLILVYLTTVRLLLGQRPGRRLVLAVVLLGSVGFVVRELALIVSVGAYDKAFDFLVFRQVGDLVLAGRDPFDPTAKLVQPNLYPPNAPPVWVIFALPGPRPGYVLWLTLNLALGIGLGALASRALATPNTGPSGSRLNTLEATILGLAVALSPSISMSFDLGQMAFLVVGLLLASLATRQASRPVLAGILFALASVKPTLTIPFLPLYSRRRDRGFWIALTVVSLAFVAVTSHGFRWLPRQVPVLARSLAAAAGPGGINDIGFENGSDETIAGIDHTLYRLGLRDRGLIRGCQLGLVLVLGLAIAREIVVGDLSWAARLSLVAPFSLLFLYHRLHDTAILILPMLYAAGRAREVVSRARVCYAIAGFACLATMWLPGRLFKMLKPMSFEWGMFPGWAFRAGVLPWATWGLILILGAQILGERLSARDRARSPIRLRGKCHARPQSHEGFR